MTNDSFHSLTASSKNGEDCINDSPLTLTVEKDINLIIEKDSLVVGKLRF